MEQFDILFLKGTSTIGKLIKWFSHGKYSHCELVIDDYHTFSTDWKYPIQVKHLEYRSGEYDLKRVGMFLTDDQKKKILEYYHMEMRRGYDYLYLLFRLFYILFRVKILNDKYRYTCDEIIVDAFKYAGVDLLDDGVLLTPSSLSTSKVLVDVGGVNNKTCHL